MAEDRISVGQDQFTCPVCLDLLKNPVTIPCGHSYCMSCITGCWNREDQEGIYSCPQCRQTFIQRPALGKNTILAEMLEKLKKTKLQAAVPAGAGDVTSALEENTKLPSPVWCVWNLTVRLILTVMKNYAQKNLEQKQKHLQQKIQKINADLQKLREDVKTHKHSAQKAVEDRERNFTELISSIERSRSEVTRLIRDQEKAAVSRAEKRMKQLEKEIDDLSRRDTELEQLSHTEDHIHFLLSFHGGTVTSYFYFPELRIRSPLPYDDVWKSVSLLKEKLKGFCKEEIEKISATVQNNEIIPTSKEEVKQLPELKPLKFPKFKFALSTETDSWGRPSTSN